MLISTLLAPSLHGTIGVQDEIALLVSPLIVLLTIVMLRLWRARNRVQTDRGRTRVKRPAYRRGPRSLHKG